MYGNEFRQMKRAHSPDGSFDGNYRGQPTFRGHPGHYGYNNKRHRGDSNFNQPQSIEDRIARLGDTGFRTQEIGLLAKDIDGELHNRGTEEEKIKSITSKICKSIVSFPTRISSYSTLIGLISVKHFNVSCQIINTLHASYPVYLEAQKWQEALTIIHLLSSLVNCKVIRPSALLSQFELMLEITLEDNIPQARSDYYVYTVLSSLPFVALELSSQAEQLTSFEQILNTIEAYLSKRSKDHLNVTRVWLSSDLTVQMDYLESLWVQMKNFRANNWNEIFLHRPYNEKEYKDIMASSLIPQNSPTIQIPAHSPDYVYPCPRIVFRLFEDDVTEANRSIPGSDKIERFCIENHIRSIIDELPNDPRSCARHLSSMYRSEQLPMKHILVETLLGELFTLPKPKHQPILYHSLLFEFSRIFPSSKNPEELKYNYDLIVNEAVKVLYENLDTMNVTCITRFVDWFSFHLNNTEFIFPWQSWADATCKEATSPKAIFVQSLLDRCIRFSFHKKVSLLVSAHLSNLLPPETSVQYKPVLANNLKAEELKQTIERLIKDKANAQAICETLNIIVDGAELPEGFELKEEKHIDKLLKIDIFTAVILEMASKSLTHLSAAIGKFRNVFKALTRATDEGQVQMLQTIHACLENHTHLQVILVDKLLKAELIEAKEICNWIFSQLMRPYLLKDYLWEILDGTIDRAWRSLNKLVNEKNEPTVSEEAAALAPGAKGTEEEKSGEEPGEAAGEDVEMKKEDDNEDDNKRSIDDEIATARAAFDEMMLQIFRMFSEILGDHIRKCETSNTSYMDAWFTWITGRMQQVYYNYHELLGSRHEKIRNILESTPSIGNSIVNLNQ